MIKVEFSVDMRRIDFWARRMGFELCESAQLVEPYLLAQPYLLRMADRLVEYHGFERLNPTDHRTLFTIVRNASGTGPSSDTLHDSIIELPVNASSFFSPDRRLQWERAFHSQLWFDGKHRVLGVDTATDLLHLLQCLLPGMFLVVEAQDGWTIQRGIPPRQWLREFKEILVASIGRKRYITLYNAAADGKRAMLDSRDATSQATGSY